jgi:hypothetical protein
VRALTMDATVLPTVAELLRADPLRPSNALLLLKLIRHVAPSPSTSATLFSAGEWTVKRTPPRLCETVALARPDVASAKRALKGEPLARETASKTDVTIHS